MNIYIVGFIVSLILLTFIIILLINLKSNNHGGGGDDNGSGGDDNGGGGDDNGGGGDDDGGGGDDDGGEKKTKLIEYFEKLFPTGNWRNKKFDKLETLYLNLDAWYTNIIDGYETEIIKRAPDWSIDRNNNIHTLSDSKQYAWFRNFDGNECDCIRFAYPSCKEPGPGTTRFSGKNLLIDCPVFPGLNVAKSYDFILKQSKSSNNPDRNYPIFTGFEDEVKGFPNYAYVESLSYPGEYGHPNICGSENIGFQPGLKIKKGNKYIDFKYPYSEGPWFYDTCSDKKPCPFSGQKCTQIKSDGSYPIDKEEGEYSICLSNKYTKENYKRKLVESFVDRSENCSKWPNQPCKALKASMNKAPEAIAKELTEHFHGFWLYPLRGIGMWRNLGNSVVANTKLGYLLTSRSQKNPANNTALGAGFEIKDIISMLGGLLKSQFQRIVYILNKGKVYKSNRYPSMTKEELQNHTTINLKQRYSESDAKNEAYNILTLWYTTGYTGLGSKFAYNGFNWNPSKFWPIGCHFTYQSTLDTMVLARMVKDKVDTLQLLVEPQAVQGGMRPTYNFEFFQATPTRRTPYNESKWSAFKENGKIDTSNDQCKTFYMIDPMCDEENYLNYGYVSKEAGDNCKEVFDPNRMTLTAAKISFD